MQTLKYILDSWWLSLIVFIAFIYIIESFKSTIKTWTRHRTLRKKGYPPEHCDVDGNPLIKIEEIIKPLNRD